LIKQEVACSNAQRVSQKWLQAQKNNRIVLWNA